MTDKVTEENPVVAKVQIEDKDRPGAYYTLDWTATKEPKTLPAFVAGLAFSLHAQTVEDNPSFTSKYEETTFLVTMQYKESQVMIEYDAKTGPEKMRQLRQWVDDVDNRPDYILQLQKEQEKKLLDATKKEEKSEASGAGKTFHRPMRRQQ